MPEVTQGSIEPEITVSAVITRADGTVEDMGVVASTKDGTITMSKLSRSKLKKLLKG